MYLLSVIFGMLLGVGCAVFIQRKKKSKRYGFPVIPERKNYADSQYLNGKKDHSAEEF